MKHTPLLLLIFAMYGFAQNYPPPNNTLASCMYNCSSNNQTLSDQAQAAETSCYVGVFYEYSSCIAAQNDSYQTCIDQTWQDDPTGLFCVGMGAYGSSNCSSASIAGQQQCQQAYQEATISFNELVADCENGCLEQ